MSACLHPNFLASSTHISSPRRPYEKDSDITALFARHLDCLQEMAHWLERLIAFLELWLPRSEELH